MKFVFILLVGLIAAAGLAQALTSPIAPNGIKYVDNNTTTLALGAAQNVSVQILYNGAPLKSEGVRVYFLANDTSRVPAELGTYVLTDSNGIAVYTATANGTGIVKLTATAMSVSSGVSTDKVFTITSGPAATPTVKATATPSPSASTTITATPTVGPTAAPTTTITPTSAPTAVPTGDEGAQATGIIVVGIVLAVIILAIVAISQMMRKK